MTTASKPATKTIDCPKCSGRGTLPHYAGTAEGKCFGCWGAGTIRVNPVAAARTQCIEDYNRAHDAVDHLLESIWAARQEGCSEEYVERVIANKIPGLLRLDGPSVRRAIQNKAAQCPQHRNDFRRLFAAVRALRVAS